MEPCLFARNFFGEGHNGFDAMVYNLKNGHRSTSEFADILRESYLAEDAYCKSLTKIVKQMSSSTNVSSFKFYWMLVRELLDQISQLHSKFSQEKQTLAKSVHRYYVDEQQKRRKSLKESESSTQDVTQSFKVTSGQLQKAKEMYHSRYADHQRVLRTEGTTTRDHEKSESKLKKAQDEYKYLIEKYNNLRSQFITKMHSSALRFQEVEEAHLVQMREFVERYVNLWSNVSKEFASLYADFYRALSKVTTERSLHDIVEKCGTGSEEPQCALFEDAEVTAAFASSPPTDINAVATMDNQIKAFDIDGYNNEQGSHDNAAVSSTGNPPPTIEPRKLSVTNRLSDRLFTKIRRNSPLDETANGLSAQQTSKKEHSAAVQQQQQLRDEQGTGSHFPGAKGTGDRGGALNIRHMAAAAGKAANLRLLGSASKLSSSRKSDAKASNQASVGDWRTRALNELPTDEEGYTIPPIDPWSDNPSVDSNSLTARNFDSDSDDQDLHADTVNRGFKGFKQPAGNKTSSRRIPSAKSADVASVDSPPKNVELHTPDTDLSISTTLFPPTSAVSDSDVQSTAIDSRQMSVKSNVQTEEPPLQQEPESCPGTVDLPTPGIASPSTPPVQETSVSPCEAAHPTESDVSCPERRRCSSATQLGSSVNVVNPERLSTSRSVEWPSEAQPSTSEKAVGHVPTIPTRTSSQPMKSQDRCISSPPKPPARQPSITKAPMLNLIHPIVLHETTDQTTPLISGCTISVAAAFTETWSVLFHNGGGSSFLTAASTTPAPKQSVTGELTLAFAAVAVEQLHMLLNQMKEEPAESTSSLILHIKNGMRIRNPKLKVPGATLVGHCFDGRSILLSQPTNDSDAQLLPPPCCELVIAVPNTVLVKLLSETLEDSAKRSVDVANSPVGPNSTTPAYLKLNVLDYTVTVEASTVPPLSPLSPPLNLCTYWRCEPGSTDFRLDYTTQWPNVSGTGVATHGNLTISLEVDGNVSRMQSLPGGIWIPELKRATWKVPLYPTPDESSASGSQGDVLKWKPNGDSCGTLRAKFTLSSGSGHPQPVVLQFYREDTLASGLQLSIPASNKKEAIIYSLGLCKHRIISEKYVCQPPGQFQ